MTNVRSWQFWVIVALALATMACAGRRERREQVREERRERAEQRRAERQEQLERKRAEREGQRASEAPAAAPPPAAAPAAVLTPVVAPAAVPAAAPDASSRVVFMRVSKQSGGIDASLFDVSAPGEPKFIGVVNNASKLAYPLKPGLYTFMVVGETAEFMQATVADGKTYYALVIPRSGARRFAIEPVRKNEIGGKEFQGWDRGTRLMPAGAQAQGYNASEAAEKRVRHWQEWIKKSESQRAELTINEEDGR